MKQLRLNLVVLFALPALGFAQSELTTWTVTRTDGTWLEARVSGAAGQQFMLVAQPDGASSLDLGAVRHLATSTLDANGAGALSMLVPAGLPADYAARLRAVYRDAANWSATPLVQQPFTGGIACQPLDFDYTLGPIEPVAGQVMSDDWALVGMHVSATNNLGGPNVACIFDSANPTGNDTDLATPGFGPNNDLALGNLLICPFDDTDLDNDGLIDNPDDDAGGSVIAFDFVDPVRICSVTLVDIDDGPATELVFFKTNGTTTIPVDNMGDNSVQTLAFLQEGVNRLEVRLGGSGGIAGLEVQPCPLLVNLDETPFGAPTGLQAGEVLTTQFQFLGLTVAAFNANLSHPDKIVLFDSENRTGDDGDLITPGYGANNDEALGLIMVIAENDVDADNDGLIDDPDDEAAGGRMEFTFDEDVIFQSIKVLDVDGTEIDTFDFYDAANNLIATIPVGFAGDNSVQLIIPDQPIQNVRRIELALGGSGAITRLRWCPQGTGR